MTGAGHDVPTDPFGVFVRDHLTTVIALCAFAPMVVISALG